MKKTICSICQRDKHLTKKAIAYRKIPAQKGPKGSFECIRRERPIKVCESCYHVGYYVKLAHRVVLQAINDYRKGPGSYDKINKRHKDPCKFAAYDSSKGFLFSKELEFWAKQTVFTVERLRYMATFKGHLDLNTDSL